MSRIRSLVAQAGQRRLHLALLAALPFVVYSNNYRHDYVLDDSYTITTNPNLRDLGAIPRYFVDPSTYTTLREQADYRPLLQVTYALNYRMGRYDTWWWHFTQILLHAIVTLGIYALARRILQLAGDTKPGRIALVAAIVFAVHPGASGVVNYLNARSSLLTAAFLLPAILAYMRPIEDERYAAPAWKSTLFYALALFTKVEALGALGALWAFELWQRGREQPGRGILASAGATFDRRTLRRIAPALGVTVAYLLVRWMVMRDYPLAAARHAADVGPYEYFLTQLTTWWYYVLRWIAPVRLIADQMSYPVFRSWTDPVVLLAAGGWVLVAALLSGAWRRAPYLLFLAVAALALISPTSSFAPLAEMVNEHRPYLPIGILSLAFFIPVGQLLRRVPPGAVARGIATGATVIAISFAMLTYRRNEVFATSASYWRDILDKAPSPRAYVNYGLTRMGANDPLEALRLFQRALELAPNWYFAHINLAAALQTVGRMDEARQYLDRAVALDHFSGLALNHRGEYLLRRGEYAAARDDFQRAESQTLDRYRSIQGLATAYAGLGDVDRALQETGRLLDLDSARAVTDVPAISTPFFRHPNLRQAGVRYYEGLTRRLSDNWWIRENIERLRTLAADAPREETPQLDAPGPAAPPVASEESLMAEGLALLYGRRDFPAAATALRRVLDVNPTHYGAHYQLAVALDGAGRRTEARPLWEKVLRMAEESGDQATVRTAQARLRQR